MRKGFIFTGTIRAMSSEGAGITDLDDGRAVFVPGTDIGETVKIRLLWVKSKFAMGEMIELLDASPQRVAPPCTHHGFTEGKCGGCPWMFLSDTAQLRLKQARVQAAIDHLAGANMAVKPIKASPKVLAYRSRAQLKTDGKQLGYVGYSNHLLAPISSCAVLSDKNQLLLKGLIQTLPCKTWFPPKRNQLTTLDIDETCDPQSVSVNKRLPFAQANREQNNYMRQWLANILTLFEAKTLVLELFAGGGNFTQIIAAQQFDKIVAVDVVDDALDVLRSKELPGVNVVKNDLFKNGCERTLLKYCKESQLLVIDPPRDGFKMCVAFLQALKCLNDIIYISCDLATWQRDARDIMNAGFCLKEVQPVDQFPQTPHIELLSYFSKPRKSRTNDYQARI